MNIAVAEIVRNVKPGNYVVGDKLFVVTGPSTEGQQGKVSIEQICQL